MGTNVSKIGLHHNLKIVETCACSMLETESSTHGGTGHILCKFKVCYHYRVWARTRLDGAKKQTAENAKWKADSPMREVATNKTRPNLMRKHLYVWSS